MYTMAKLTDLWAQRFKRGIHCDLQKRLLPTLPTPWGGKSGQGGSLWEGVVTMACTC